MGRVTDFKAAVVVTAAFLFIYTGFAYAQDASQAASNTETSEQTSSVVSAQIESQALPDTQWLWGEVVSTDITNQQVQVKYFDYEADTEKDINITVDPKTTYENIKGIEELKPLDTVSIDYAVNAEGKNIAKNISVEKVENAAAPAQTETAPQATPEQPYTPQQ